MSRLQVPRLLATGATVTASTAFRIGTTCAGLWARRVPTLVQLGVRTLAGENDGRSDGALRDELIGLLRDSAEVSWRELRRGVNDFDAFTRTDDSAREPGRPFRVKP